MLVPNYLQNIDSLRNANNKAIRMQIAKEENSDRINFPHLIFVSEKFYLSAQNVQVGPEVKVYKAETCKDVYVSI